MSRFSEFFRKKEPEIDVKALELLQGRVLSVEKKLKKFQKGHKQNAIDLDLLFDKAQKATARMRERAKKADKKNEEGLIEEGHQDDGMQQLRDKLAARRSGRQLRATM